MPEKIKIGISACLLGEKVRYDGGHKLDAHLIESLGKYAEFVPVCPEVECGMPVPREPMKLVGGLIEPRLVTINTGLDLTDKLRSWAEKEMIELENESLCGFVLKSRSPSCGVSVRGVFARILMDRFPFLPIEEEASLRDPEIMRDFINRVSARNL